MIYIGNSKNADQKIVQITKLPIKIISTIWDTFLVKNINSHIISGIWFNVVLYQYKYSVKIFREVHYPLKAPFQREKNHAKHLKAFEEKHEHVIRTLDVFLAVFVLKERRAKHIYSSFNLTLDIKRYFGSFPFVPPPPPQLSGRILFAPPRRTCHIFTWWATM